MIERDRELLAKVGRVNQHIGNVIVEMLTEQDGGELPADGVRDLGRNLAELGADLLARAAELDGRTIERVIINART